MKRVVFVLCMFGITQANELKKIYVHDMATGSTLNEAPQLELTKAVFYFAQEPKMHQLVHGDHRQNEWKHETYFFTIDAMDESCKKNLPEMQRKNDYYHLVCTQVAEPRKGVRLEICYDPQRIMCVRESFEAITGDKGIVFRFINKKLLEDMQRFNKPLLQTACNNLRRVLIDCGHGGRDPGAIGVHNVAEKNITLQVGNALAHFLRNEGCEVFMTRDTDLFVPLTTRTHMINARHPDVFISIHANSAPQVSVKGIETYCLNADVFSDFVCVDDACGRFKDVLHQRYAKSQQLAESVHACMLTKLSSHAVLDRKIKHAASQVLLGANVPGILVEVGFVTHAQEAALLVQSTYQELIAHGMCEGIMKYLKA